MSLLTRMRWLLRQRLASLLHSAAFRAGVLQAALFGLIALALFGVTWWSVSGYIEKLFRSSILNETHEIAGIARSHLPATLLQLIRRAPDGPYYFGYMAQPGAPMQGNFPANTAHAGWQQIRLPPGPGVNADDVVNILAYGEPMADGTLLLVGRDRRSEEQLSDDLQLAFCSAAGIAVLVALLGGWFAARRYLDRVDTVSASAGRIVDGDLSARIPLTGRNDEFDRLARTLNSMLARIQQLMESMRQVSSDVAHDLRTPLTHLRQRLEQALAQASTVDGYQHAVERAVLDVDRVLETFSALLRIAQIESRQLRRSFMQVNLSQLVESLAEDYAPVFEDQHHPLTVDIARDVHCNGDPSLLTQMLANLLENTLQHTPPGTCTQLQLRKAAHGAAIQLDDDGPGIPADQRQRVFHRFTRLDTARSSPGAGLGMALVAAVAERHGIGIELGDARPGLSITLYIPEG